jgi:hypothetical protein
LSVASFWAQHAPFDLAVRDLNIVREFSSDCFIIAVNTARGPRQKIRNAKPEQGEPITRQSAGVEHVP